MTTTTPEATATLSVEDPSTLVPGDVVMVDHQRLTVRRRGAQTLALYNSDHEFVMDLPTNTAGWLRQSRTFPALGPIETEEARDSLPIGTVIRNGYGRNIEYEVLDHSGVPTLRTTASDSWSNVVNTLRTDGYHHVMRLPFPHVGAIVAERAQWVALPHGSIIRNMDGGVRYQIDHGETRTLTQLYSDGARVVINRDFLDPRTAPALNVFEVEQVGAGSEVADVVTLGPVHDQRFWVDCPHGTIVRNRTGRWSMVHAENGLRWLAALSESDRNLDIRNGSEVRNDGWLSAHYIPGISLEVGTGVTNRSQWALLPAGTTLRQRSGDPEPQWRIDYSGGERKALVSITSGQVLNNDLAHNTGTRTDGFLVVHSYPWASLLSVTPPEPIQRGEIDPALDLIEGPSVYEETLEEFKANLRTVCIQQAVVSSVSLAPVREVMRSLDIGLPSPLRKGMKVGSRDTDMIATLPTGTVIRTPDNAWLHVPHQGATPELLVGPATGRWVGHIHDAPGIAESNQERLTPEQREEIAIFKDEVWRMGVRAKSANSWCGDFERAMADAGVASSNPPSAETLTAEEMSESPEGTIFFYDGHEGSLLVIRDNRATNEARTRYLGGTIRASWARALKRIAGSFPKVTPGLLESMPVGTAVSTSTSARTRTSYHKTTSGRWVHADPTGHGIHNSDVFDRSFFIVNIPGTSLTFPS